jgi:E3 ubiquitin-protein ligase UBR2
MREKIQNSSGHGGSSLKCDVIPSYVIAHQHFAARLLNWVLNLFKISSGFRSIFCEVVFSVRQKYEDNSCSQFFY